METTIELEKVVKEMPGLIDEMLEQLNKFTQAGEFVKDVAKQSGANDFIADSEHMTEVFDNLREMCLKLAGNEGDTLTGDGTLWGIHSAAKQLEQMTGGEA